MKAEKLFGKHVVGFVEVANAMSKSICFCDE